ncbi:MAG TPA: hypothetical protein VIX59_09910 [Candidatus Binataceae bacterium]
MSVLDLLTGALGAFCFLTLALFPSYFKVTAASAAGKAVETKAAEALKAMHVKLQSELASAQANQHGMPPFAMAFVTMSGPENTFCGAFQVTDAIGPGGKAAVKLLPNGVKNGYDVNLNMFLLAPGTYQLSLQAYAQSMPCTFILDEFGASGTEEVKADFQTGTASYTLKFDVQAADLQFAQILKQ